MASAMKRPDGPGRKGLRRPVSNMDGRAYPVEGPSARERLTLAEVGKPRRGNDQVH